MNVLDKIMAAAREGEAELEAKRRVLREEVVECDRKNREWAREAAIKADAWVRDELPALVRAESARGQRKLRVDEYHAGACRRAGLQVTQEWVEGWNDDGCRFGDYWDYQVHW